MGQGDEQKPLPHYALPNFSVGAPPTSHLPVDSNTLVAFAPCRSLWALLELGCGSLSLAVLPTFSNHESDVITQAFRIGNCELRP